MGTVPTKEDENDRSVAIQRPSQTVEQSAYDVPCLAKIAKEVQES